MLKKCGKTIDKHLKMIQYFVFLCFFILMYMQFRLVGVQYDDYGYYTLNYGAITPHFGTEYSFSELFRFLGEHYYGANGRLLYDAIWLTIYKIGGLTAVQIAAALTVTVIWYLLCKIGSSTIEGISRYKIIYGAIILCLCYGSMDILLHQHGTYWFAAFFTYYMPIIATELFVICYEKVHNKLKWRHMLILIPLVIASAWSGETWSVGTVALMFVLLARECWNKKRLDIKHLLLVGGSATGLMILLNSPGIQQRAGDRQWGIAGIKVYEDNIKAAFSLFFSEFNQHYLFYILTACCILAVILYLQRRVIVDLICAVGIVVLELFMLVDYSLLRDIIGRTWGTTALCIGIVLLCIMIPVCRYYYFKADEKRIMLLIVAFMALVSLAAVPEIQLRIYIPFEVCSFLIVFDAVQELYEGLMKGKLRFEKLMYRRAAIIMFALYISGMTAFSIKNYKGIYVGYKENAVIDQYNNAAFLQAKERIDQGEEVSAVYLKRYVNDIYATITLYQQQWFKIYIDRYYELPGEVEYIFE